MTSLRSLFLLTGVGLGLLLAWVVGANLPAGFHPRNMDCTTCHLAENVTKKNAHQLIANQEQLCRRCHATAMQVAHPSGMPPHQAVPKNFPLDWKGDVTCSTCHFIHPKQSRHLRGAGNGRTFCLECHAESFFSAMIDKGTSIERSGHLAEQALPEGVDLDPYSRQCMSCHIENGSAIAMKIDTRGIVRHSSGKSNHPVGMAYGQVVGTELYRNRSELKPQIFLPGGKVGCVSCHQGYSQQHGALVMSNDRSALCLECHDI